MVQFWVQVYLLCLVVFDIFMIMNAFEFVNYAEDHLQQAKAKIAKLRSKPSIIIGASKNMPIYNFCFDHIVNFLFTQFTILHYLLMIEANFCYMFYLVLTDIEYLIWSFFCLVRCKFDI